MTRVMLSVRPEWVAKILNGEKTIEVRKTAPKCELPVDVYVYCTKGDYIGRISNKYVGKVVAKFTLREVTQYINGCNVSKDSGYMFGDAEREGVYEKSCLSESDIDGYCPDESFYAWHISDLAIFDEPKDLPEFGLKRAPQSWFYLKENK